MPSRPFGNLTLCVFLTMSLVLAACAEKPTYQEVGLAGDEVVIALDGLREAEPVFYSFHHEGKKIDFIVLKIDGEVQSYFDACAKCFPKKLGYRAADGELRCVACGERYPLDDLRGIGSCYPVLLEGKPVGQNYIIKKAAIIRGARYF